MTSKTRCQYRRILNKRFLNPLFAALSKYWLSTAHDKGASSCRKLLEDFQAAKSKSEKIIKKGGMEAAGARIALNVLNAVRAHAVKKCRGRENKILKITFTL